MSQEIEQDSEGICAKTVGPNGDKIVFAATECYLRDDSIVLVSDSWIDLEEIR